MVGDVIRMASNHAISPTMKKEYAIMLALVAAFTLSGCSSQSGNGDKPRYHHSPVPVLSKTGLQVTR